MSTVRRLLFSLMIVLVAAGTHVVNAADPVRHSGRILAIDSARGQLVIEEVGPWQVRDGVTQMIRRTIMVTPTTQIAIMMRANPAGGFAGDFIEGRLDADDLEIGDFVTAECRRQGSRLVAVKIVVADATEVQGPQP
jgi:hypothetical protein